jgi:hypothetical protein
VLTGRQGRTQTQVKDEFNGRHPERNPVAYSAVGKLNKFKETGSVIDKPRVGRPSVGEHSNWSDCQISCTFPLVPDFSHNLYIKSGNLLAKF